MSKNLRIVRIPGTDIEPYILDLAALRSTVFKDYPYLYAGDLAYEKKYLATYAACPQSIILLVFDDQKVVGASTALPLSFETEECKAPFLAAEMSIENIFYLGESVLLREYRGQQIGRQFFQEREAAAREYGATMAAFCSVERVNKHGDRPADWFPLNNFWLSLGYTRHPELKTFFSWRDISDTEETQKPMIFWLKDL
jgi:GNAT superfamily N-acetyltransferase